MSHDRTRVVSLNTDSVTLQVARGDEQAVNEIIAAWEAQFGFQMERTELLDHRALNINNYIELSQEDGKAAQIKSKGALAHAPGIAADHDRLIVAQAVGAWMREGTPIEKTIRSAIDAREILRFTEMRSAPSGALCWMPSPLGESVVCIDQPATIYRYLPVQRLRKLQHRPWKLALPCLKVHIGQRRTILMKPGMSARPSF